MVKDFRNEANIITKHDTNFLGKEILEFFMAPMVKIPLIVLSH
jgi:hypothetical protein